MIWRNIKRIARSGFTSFWRGGIVSLAPVVIMVSTLFVIGSLIFLGASFNFLLASLKDKVDITIYFVPEAAESDVLALKEKIEHQPEVQSVEYLSREEALERFKIEHANDELILQSLEVIGENPLGANLNIKARDIAQLESVANFLGEETALSAGGLSIVDNINYNRNREVIDRLSKIIDAVQRLSLLVILLFIVLSVTITFNTITLAIYSSRDEISVMRLVGASDPYIRGPFVVQGMIMGAIATVAVMILFYPLTFWLGPVTEFAFAGMNIYDYYLGNILELFAVLLVSGVVLGAFSSYLAVRKHIKF
jgi:cell division transport system permease protein